MAGTGAFAEIIDGDVIKFYADEEWKKSSSWKSFSIIIPTSRKTRYKVQDIPPFKYPVNLVSEIVPALIAVNSHFLKPSIQKHSNAQALKPSNSSVLAENQYFGTFLIRYSSKTIDLIHFSPLSPPKNTPDVH